MQRHSLILIATFTFCLSAYAPPPEPGKCPYAHGRIAASGETPPGAESGPVPVSPSSVTAFGKVNLQVPQLAQAMVSSLAFEVTGHGISLEAMARGKLSTEQRQDLIRRMNRVHEAYGVRVKTAEAAGPNDRVIEDERLDKLFRDSTKLAVGGWWTALRKTIPSDVTGFLKGDISDVGLARAVDSIRADQKYAVEVAKADAVVTAMRATLNDPQVKVDARDFRESYRRDENGRVNPGMPAKRAEMQALYRKTTREKLREAAPEVTDKEFNQIYDAFIPLQ